MNNNDLLVEIGANIRKLRLDKGYSQGKLAKLLVISDAALSKIEHGYTDINISRLLQICKCLDCELADIIPHFSDRSNVQYSTDKSIDLLLAEKDKELISLQKKLIQLYEKMGL